MYAEVDCDLPNHPKSLRLATLLKESRAWTRMVELWLWCLRYARHGDTSNLSDGELSQACGYPVDADPTLIGALRKNLVISGFLDESGKLHGWKDWNKYLKSKRVAMRKHRSKCYPAVTGNRPSVTGNRPSVTGVLPLNGTELNGTDPFPPISPPLGDNGYTKGFELLWKAAPSQMKVGKGKAFNAFRKKKLEPRASEIAAVLKHWDLDDRWRKTDKGERCYPMLATWINGGRYDDAS